MCEITNIHISPIYMIYKLCEGRVVFFCIRRVGEASGTLPSSPASSVDNMKPKLLNLALFVYEAFEGKASRLGLRFLFQDGQRLSS